MAIFRLGEVSAYDSIDYFLDNLLWSYAFLKRYIYMLVCREGLLRRATCSGWHICYLFPRVAWERLNQYRQRHRCFVGRVFMDQSMGCAVFFYIPLCIGVPNALYLLPKRSFENLDLLFQFKIIA